MVTIERGSSSWATVVGVGLLAMLVGVQVANAEAGGNHLDDTGNDSPPPMQVMDFCSNAWTKISDLTGVNDPMARMKLRVEDNRVLLVADNGATAKVSYDGGQSFADVVDLAGETLVSFSAAGSTLTYMLASAPEDVMVLTGDDWASPTNPTRQFSFPSGVNSVGNDVCNNGIMEIVLGSADNAALLASGGYHWYTANGGTNWFNLMENSAAFKCSISPSGEQAYIIGSSTFNFSDQIAANAMYYTTDSGQTWELFSFYVSGSQITDFQSSDTASYMLHPQNGIYRTTKDWFRAWRDGWDNNGLPVGAPSQFGNLAVHHNAVFVDSLDDSFGILASSNAGQDWGQLVLPQGLDELTSSGFYTNGIWFDNDVLYAIWVVNGLPELRSTSCPVLEPTQEP